jgi:hypothetical protein
MMLFIILSHSLSFLLFCSLQVDNLTPYLCIKPVLGIRGFAIHNHKILELNLEATQILRIRY